MGVLILVLVFVLGFLVIIHLTNSLPCRENGVIIFMIF